MIATATSGLPFWMAQVRSAPMSLRFHWNSKKRSFGVNLVLCALRTMPFGSAKSTSGMARKRRTASATVSPG